MLALVVALPTGPGAMAESDSTAQACPVDRLVVAVDVGHHLTAPGATSATGRTEYAFNRDLAGRLLAQLHQVGVTGAFLVEETGAPIDLWARPRRAGARGAHLFVSVHHDSVQPQYLRSWVHEGRERRYADRFQGHSLFVSRKNLYLDESLAVARAIGRALRSWGLTPSLHHAEPIPGENRPLVDKDLGIYDFADLVVLKAAPMPAVLFEAGIIVNRAEEARLRESFHQDMLIDAVVTGILERCFALVEK
ncbi:N-acetylmuramoyl-L-alanine amidase family protein [Roseospira visakhapatnamensis]|uniref:N-acetylmuramoyl-L-alanine amidase n=1 Tax=Roseospira visakhapatnamensis TaxID=390880 RepID=A0A7W6RA68_9PROT|nr:N-acetylmuramoyl-L-alanine amidase [Roseospira visakhapatnamensis]MBB4264743.1 N-acetylmuramoyl-L-alanine amidase [Roseospira visakhapatnamensis]